MRPVPAPGLRVAFIATADGHSSMRGYPASMATGWASDSAVQEQIDATVEDAILRARAKLPTGPSLSHCEACDAPIPEARRQAQAVSEEPLGRLLKRPEVVALIGACCLMAAAHAVRAIRSSLPAPPSARSAWKGA